MKLSPRYVLFESPPPTIRGTKSTCWSPTVRGFCNTTLLHCAGHRKSNVASSNGMHAEPSSPHPSSAAQYVAVHPIKESAGVKNDWARVKKAKPIIQPAARTANSHGFVRGRVRRMSAGSRAME